MVLARVVLLSSGSNTAPPQHAISLLVRPSSALISSGNVVPDVSHLSLPECVVLMSGFDQTTVRSAGANHPSASAPTLALSGFPCNRSSVFASSATLLLLTQSLVCCIHRLNPQSKAARERSVGHPRRAAANPILRSKIATSTLQLPER